MRISLKRNVKAEDVMRMSMDNASELNKADRKFFNRFENVLYDIEQSRKSVHEFSQRAAEVAEYDASRRPSLLGELQKARELDMELGKHYAQLEVLMDLAPFIVSEVHLRWFFEVEED